MLLAKLWQFSAMVFSLAKLFTLFRLTLPCMKLHFLIFLQFFVMNFVTKLTVECHLKMTWSFSKSFKVNCKVLARMRTSTRKNFPTAIFSLKQKNEKFYRIAKRYKLKYPKTFLPATIKLNRPPAFWNYFYVESSLVQNDSKSISVKDKNYGITNVSHS